ncbi:MAG TPA: ABC transporter permease, partial [Terriglobales bacterium]|nr:ABC transporter permease [Terriglobales bacterium]
MNWITQLRKRQDLCDDLSQEIREHLEQKKNELIEGGMSPAEASAAANREFGNAALIEERGRETWHWMSLEDFLSDLRYGARALRKNPGFTLVAVLTLALGIGANSAMFSLVNAVLLRPLPFAQPDRLVSLSEHNWYPQGGFVAMRTTLQTMDVASYLPGVEFNLTGQGEAERLTGTRVSANFFSLLGVQAELGRIFQAGEDQPGKNSKVILTHNLWQNKFHADPGVIGRQIMLGDESREVVGVMPADFRPGSSKTELWVPLNLDPAGDTYWRAEWVPVIGRLREGASPAQAQAEVELLQHRMLTMFPWKMPSNTWEPAKAIPLQQQVVGDVRPRLLILLGAIGLVLLIACANVANLLLARAAARQREMAVRATLGAGRWRICRQLLTESTLLGAAGAATGLAFSYFAIAWLKAILPVDDIPRLATVSIDLRVLLFTGAIGILTGLVFGLAPALQLSKVDLTESLKTGSKNAVAASHRVRSALAVSEIALAVVLVTAAGLMVKSLWQLVHVDPGFRSESILSARI